MIRLLPLMLCLAAATAEARPQRIVSLNLCADQYLIALADPDQIAALTPLARDPVMSAGAARARSLPVANGHAEEVLARNPDLILASPFRRREALAAVDGSGKMTIDVPPAESYAAIVEQIRLVARAVGHPARGEALIRQMDAELATIPRSGRGRVAAYYQRRGYMTGTGTLIDELMGRIGLVNLANKLDKPALALISLEEMVASRPDFLIVESNADKVVDQGTEMLHHPALRPIPRLALPQAWTVCGGPAYVLAAKSLAAQLQARH
ncbi:cobalamin ABC transporter substrate-binding protein [Sphingomonas sp. DBB INV C78]|uniref:ABC transporter substrate-binding protein n=1 Tax=Sphingomonas sp. DBB INV C78 TaxID=3349434 RepID=UPI0036D3EEBB